MSFIVSLSLVRRPSSLQLGACLVLLLASILVARLPFLQVVRISLLAVPFVGVFAIVVYFSGDPARAWFILAKSYLSALAVLVTVSSTSLPRLIAAGHSFHLPELLLELTQIIYRYFFVIGRQSHQMQIAFRSRAGRRGGRAIRASAGIVAILFGKSYQKAMIVHQAMLSRGFSGKLPVSPHRAFHTLDLTAILASLVFAGGLHFL